MKKLRMLAAVFFFLLATLPTGSGQSVTGQIEGAVTDPAGAGYLVYSSSAGADRPTLVPFMESKRVVEEHLRSLPVPSAVVAPVYCMDNVRFPWNLEPLRAGRVVHVSWYGNAAGAEVPAPSSPSQDGRVDRLPRSLPASPHQHNSRPPPGRRSALRPRRRCSMRGTCGSGRKGNRLLAGNSDLDLPLLAK